MKTKRLLAVLLAAALVICAIPLTSAAVVAYNLTPADVSAESGNLTLSKTAVRTAADEWQVTMKVKTGNISVNTQPIEVAFVLDVSGSMDWDVSINDNSRRIKVATDAANSLLGSLETTFGTSLTIHLFKFSSTASSQSGTRYPTYITPGGSTNLIAGFNLAKNSFTITGSKRYIIVLTDGDPNEKPNPSGEGNNVYFPFNSAAAFKTAGGTVYTIAFAANILGLTQIASDNGTYTASDFTGLTAAMNSIASQLQLVGAVYDPIGTNLTVNGTASVTGALPAAATVKNSGALIEWTPTGGALAANSTITISYNVKLDASAISNYLGQDSAVPLNGAAVLNYQVTGAAMKSLAFPLPGDMIDVGKLDVDYKITGSTDDAPGAPTFATQYMITDYGTPAFTVEAAKRPSSIDASPLGTYMLASAQYDGVDIALTDIGSIAATYGAHKLTLYYTFRDSPPVTYPYTVHYVYYLDNVVTTAVNTPDFTGNAPEGALALLDNGGKTDTAGNLYALGDASSLSVTIDPETQVNEFTLRYYASTEVEPTPTHTNLPPQVVTPTPVPTEEIIVPPEEIPTEETPTEIVEEEVPTDVPQTGDSSSAILPGFALALIAGAALAMTLKKKKHN